MNCSSYDAFFETFSNKTRMKIIEALLKGSKSVNEICDYVNEEQSKVSHNLKRLMECNFLDVKQKGKQRIYSLNKETVIPIINIIEKHIGNYCKGCREHEI